MPIKIELTKRKWLRFSLNDAEYEYYLPQESLSMSEGDLIFRNDDMWLYFYEIDSGSMLPLDRPKIGIKPYHLFYEKRFNFELKFISDYKQVLNWLRKNSETIDKYRFLL